jgi:hypothetical protein
MRTSLDKRHTPQSRGALVPARKMGEPLPALDALPVCGFALRFGQPAVFARVLANGRPNGRIAPALSAQKIGS